MNVDQQFSHSIQNLPKAIYTCDEKGFIKMYNKAAAELWGRQPALGKDLWCGSWKIFTTDGSCISLENWPMAVTIREEKPVYGNEIVIQRPDGSLRHVNPYPSPIFNDKGVLTGAVNMLIDITEQRAKETLMLQSEEQYKTLVAEASEAIFIFNRQGHLLEVNDRASEILGYSKEELGSMNVRQLFTQTDLATQQLKLKELIDGERVQTERTMLRKDNKPLQVGLTSTMLSDGRIMSIVRDFTELKKAEIIKAKAIIKTQENERFQIGIELHDNVNQILAVSIMNIGMIQKADPERIAEYTVAAKNYILSAIEELRKISHRLAPTISENISLKKSFETLLKSMNINNQFNITTQFHLLKKAIPTEVQLNLYRIVQEQLTNVFKYSKATAISISVTQRIKSISLTIADNGIGFNAAAIQDGIGLSNIKKRVQILDGQFLLTTTPGNGCKINLTIPL